MDTTKDLLKNKELLNTVEGFFGDKTFYYEVTSRAKEIVADGKLDTADIPNLLLLVTTILNKSPKLKVNKNNMKPLIKMVIIKLLVEVKFLEDEENPLSDEQEMYIDSGLALLNSNVTLDGCFQYIKDVICGCFNNEDSIVSEFLDKQKATRDIVKMTRATGVLENGATAPKEEETGDEKENETLEATPAIAAASTAEVEEKV
jgi:hypothetical protein